MLESLNSETPNIKDLVIEEDQEKDFSFDPEKELTEEDFEHFREFIESKKFEPTTSEDVRWQNYLVYSAELKYLSPRQFELLDGKREFLEKMSPRVNISYDSAISDQTYYQMVYPNMLARPTMDSLFLKFQRKLEETIIFNRVPVAIKILFPENSQTEQLLTQNVLEKLLESAEITEHSSLAAAAMEYCNARIAFPDADTSNWIDKETWKKFRQLIQRLRSDGEYTRMITLAYNLKVLAAEKVSITDRGLELTMPNQFDEQKTIPPLPNQRSF